MPTSQELYVKKQIARNNPETAITVKDVSSEVRRNFVPLTFPASTTQIPIKGVRGTWYEITGLGNPNGGLLITDIVLTLGITAIPSGMGIFRVFLYNSPPAVTLTNAQTWAIGADIDKMPYPDGIPLNNVVVGQDGTLVISQNFGLQYNVTLSSTGSLYLYIVNTTTAFTPANPSETGRIEIAGIQI
jgi:hypothetical protein